MNEVKPYYRNKASQELAERLENPNHAAETLKINISVEQILAKRDPEIAVKINECIENNIPFMLYADKDNYAIVYPEKRIINGHVRGRKDYVGVSEDNVQFANNVKMLYVGFEKMFIPTAGILSAMEEYERITAEHKKLTALLFDK